MNKLDVLVQHLGIHKQMAGNNLYFHCPSCQHHNNKLTVNLDKSVYNCWHCGLKGRSFVYLLRLAGAIKPNQYRNLFEEDKKNSDIDNLFDEQRDVEEKKTLSLPSKYQPLFNNVNKMFFQPAVNYLINRGVQKDDFIRYDIHYSIGDQRVLFPSYDDAEQLNYYVCRSINPAEKIKYKNAQTSKRGVIFNEHLVEWDKEVYLVEGIFDAIISRKNAIPILGSSINAGFKLFKKVIKHKPPVVIALDVDARKKCLSIAEQFGNFGVEVKFVDWKKGEERDIAEMGSEEFLTITASGVVRSVEFKDTIKERLFS